MSAASGSAIYSRLSGDSALTALGSTGVYYGVAPQSAVAPFVTIQLADGQDSRVFHARATVQERWLVKGWDTGSSHLRATRIYERCDALLDEYALVVGGGTAMACRRVGQLPDLSEVANGVTYRQAGGRYELEVRA
tara:strand:- start:1055 stop:1462 length:408 start_codon:yes stop_codon:yes gene_type:complete